MTNKRKKGQLGGLSISKFQETFLAIVTRKFLPKLDFQLGNSVIPNLSLRIVIASIMEWAI